MEAMLKGSGYEVVSAANGMEALERLRAEGFDMIVSDILMPVMDGFKLCQECKGDEELKDIPFVFYTATYKDEMDERLALKLGADKFLIKPIEPEEFIKIIQGVFRDLDKGKVGQKKPVVEEEKEVLKLYSERLISKLEKKMLNLEAETAQRKQAQERTRHLNRVLHAIRSVNQLIIREKDCQTLLKEACVNLIKTGGYYNTWIALLGESGELVTYAEAGLGKDFLPVVEQLKHGELITCAQQALVQAGVVATKDPFSTCIDCSLAKKYQGRAAMTTRLQHNEKVYGLLVASVPAEFAAGEEEQSMFQEVASDIAFALHDIELGEKHKQAEEILHRKEAILSESQRIGHIGSWELDIVSNTLTWSDEVYRLFELEPQQFEATYEAFLDNIHPDDREMVGKAYTESVRNKTPYDIVHRLLLKDGTVKYVNERCESFFDDDGKPIRSLGIVQDITERKQAEEELHLERDKLTNILDSMKDGIYIANSQYEVEYVNPVIETQFGSVEGRKCYKYFHDLEEVCPWCKNQAVFAGETVRWEWYSFKNQRTYDLIDTPLKNADGSISKLEIFRDITERKQAEERIRHLNLVLRTLRNVNQLITKEKDRKELLKGICKNLTETRGYYNTWIALLDESGKLTEYAESGLGKDFLPMGKLLKQGRLPACGQTALKQSDAVVTEDPALVCTDCPISDKFAGRGGVAVRLEHGGKVYGLLSVSISLELAKDVEELGLFHEVAGDIAFALYNIEREEQHKEAEAERQELEKRVQLTDRLASIGEMASGIAHEINNPLTSVVGFSELLLEKDLPEDLKEDVEIIHDGSKRVTGIIKRLLTFARQHKPVQSRTDINEIIESTLALRSYALETGNIEVSTSLDAELPWTMADTGQLQQVFMNIIVNAETEMRKAHGRGKLIVKTEQIGNTIRISFADDGPGIARENIGKVFDPFFTTKEAGEGTGLGLSLSYGIIAEHKGALYVESEVGKGATFIIELPVVAEEEEKIERVAAVEEAGKAPGGRILVVDDEPTILTFLKKVLGGEGYDVETAGSGEEALKRIGSEEYGLILCDVKLPGLSGIEIYEQIGKVVPSLQKRVIFITGDVISADTREFLKETRVPYVTKPFDIAKLKKEVRRVIVGAG